MVSTIGLGGLALAVTGIESYAGDAMATGNLPVVKRGEQIRTHRLPPSRLETFYAEVPPDMSTNPIDDYGSRPDRDQGDVKPETGQETDPKTDANPAADPDRGDSEVGDNSANGHVARAIFTREVVEREPVDQVESPVVVPPGESINLYYFTDIREMPGETISHHWFHEHKSIAQKKFEIGGNRWRVFSSKRIQANMPGRWEVQVKDSQGEIIQVDNFVVSTSDERGTAR